MPKIKDFQEKTSLKTGYYPVVLPSGKIKKINHKELWTLTSEATCDPSNAAGIHRSYFRGKNLGNTVTSDQSSAITTGSFEDIWLGDYWTISNDTYQNVVFRVADFNYFPYTGTNHIVIVPDKCIGYPSSSYESLANAWDGKFGSKTLSYFKYYPTSKPGVDIAAVDNIRCLALSENMLIGTRKALPFDKVNSDRQLALFKYSPNYIPSNNTFELRDGILFADDTTYLDNESPLSSGSYRLRPLFVL